METRKATSSAVRLDLCALAELRMPELREHPACKQCKDCDGSRCATWASRTPVLERRDWPACPIGMTRAPGWRDARDTYIAAKVSPLSDYPNGFVAGGTDALIELKHAAGEEERRQLDAAATGTPVNKEPVRRTGRVA
jgi:hypothetical protein